MPATTVNTTNFLRSLKSAIQKRHAASIQIAADFAGLVLVDAKAICPVAQSQESLSAPPPGTLQASGITSAPTVNGNIITVTIAFTAPYAAIVHEDLTAHHAQGQAKFLETAMRQKAPQFPSFVAGRLNTIS